MSDLLDAEAPIAEFHKIRMAYDRGKNGEALQAEHGQFSTRFFATINAALTRAPNVVES